MSVHTIQLTPQRVELLRALDRLTDGAESVEIVHHRIADHARPQTYATTRDRLAELERYGLVRHWYVFGNPKKDWRITHVGRAAIAFQERKGGRPSAVDAGLPAHSFLIPSL